jgi:hypothetical protein
MVWYSGRKVQFCLEGGHKFFTLTTGKVVTCQI